MEKNAKKQVIERLKEAQNILVTVSDSPSVDQLSAAIGFTLIMNKLDKRATAVFSGDIPSTIEFLSPEDTIETNTDSLRDFIIALDKSKADKLKYKVEDNVVKVFITPYKTALSQDDLEFSQGDFNVDVVVALGVNDREHLDQAIITHGRILHDATVISVMAGDEVVDLAGINWQDPNASSLCEMLASISDSFKPGLFDSQIATAYLTGIVSETERFSNEKTSPKVMKLSAELMASGANQQLISTELTPVEPYQQEEGYTYSDDEGEDEELPAPEGEDEFEPPRGDVIDENGVLTLHHEDDEHHLPEPQPEPEQEDDLPYADEAIHIDDTGIYKSANELNAAVNQVQNDAVQEEEVDDQNEQLNSNQHFSKYVPTPAATVNPLNSNVAAPQLEPAIDPLSDIPVANNLDNEASTPPVEENKESPLLTTQHDAESPRASEVPSTSDFRLQSDGEQKSDTPLGPEVNSNETLESIEDKVMKFEETASKPFQPTPILQPEPQSEDEIGLPSPIAGNVRFDNEPVKSAEPVVDVDQVQEEARQAVNEARDEAGNFDPDRPEPVQSLGAKEFNEPQIIEPNVEPSAPPPDAPPPIFPPFPQDNSTSPQNQNQ